MIWICVTSHIIIYNVHGLIAGIDSSFSLFVVFADSGMVRICSVFCYDTEKWFAYVNR